MSLQKKKSLEFNFFQKQYFIYILIFVTLKVHWRFFFCSENILIQIIYNTIQISITFW